MPAMADYRVMEIIQQATATEEVTNKSCATGYTNNVYINAATMVVNIKRIKIDLSMCKVYFSS